MFLTNIKNLQLLTCLNEKIHSKNVVLTCCIKLLSVSCLNIKHDMVLHWCT